MKKKIFIIEDEASISKVYNSAFRSEGFDVLVAENGKQALENIDKFDPDVVLHDIMLPDINGFELFQKLKQKISDKNPQPKIIMFSNIDSKRYEEKGYGLGFDYYLVKANVTPTEVVRKVQEWLGIKISESDSVKKMKQLYPIQLGEKNQVLRNKSEAIDVIDDDILEFSKDLMNLLWLYGGTGLAAPQVGKNIQVIAVTQWGFDKENQKRRLLTGEIMINPEIYFKSKKQLIAEEKCLSLPDEICAVPRSDVIRVKYVDKEGKLQDKEFDGMNARIIQHEIDHLNGVLFIDYC